MSADARSWWDPRLRADDGGRREEFGAASGVLLRLPMMWLAMAHRDERRFAKANSKYSGGVWVGKDYCKTPAGPAEFA